MDSLLTQGNNVTWFFASETNPGLMPGQAADFWFTTPFQAIAAVGGQGLSYDLGEEVAGPTVGPVAPPVITLTVGNNNFIPLNANDTYGAPLMDFRGNFVADGVPFQDAYTGNPPKTPIYDFQVNPMRQWVSVGPEQLKDDPDLVQASFNVANPVPGGNVVVNVTLSNAQNHGQIRLWKERDKWTDYGAQNPHALTDNIFYIEGDEPSTALNDITITAIYNFGPGAQSVQTSQTVTVTPMINSFTITPRPVTPPATAVVFTNGMNGLQGMTTTDGATPGMKFSADLKKSGVSGMPVYLQRFEGVDNGANGAGAGFVFTAASGIPKKNLLLNNGLSYPILDTANPPPSPFKSGLSYPVNTPDQVQLLSDDSPSIISIDGAADLERIDVTMRASLYLVWSFADHTLYPLAKIGWKVVFDADTYVATKGVTHVRNTSVISVQDNPYKVWHDPNPLNGGPVWGGPTFNNSNYIGVP